VWCRQVANKPKPPPDVEEHWRKVLREATVELQRKRAEALRAEHFQRMCVRDSFDAGLSVTPIREETGLTVSRLYQIKRGTRGGSGGK
jgi:hypothetical protein